MYHIHIKLLHVYTYIHIIFNIYIYIYTTYNTISALLRWRLRRSDADKMVNWGLSLIGDDISRISTIRMAKHFSSLYWAMSYQLK